MAQAKLFDRIGNYWDSRQANGRDGLVLLDECIRRAASKDRDWDALARFVARANVSSNAAKVKKIIRAAFGNNITFTLDKKHAAGGKFELKWEGAFPLSGSNTYTFVKKAIEQGKSWDDREFLKALGEVIPALPKKEKLITPAEQTKAAKAIATKLAELRKEGFDVAAIIREAQAELATKVIKIEDPAH